MPSSSLEVPSWTMCMDIEGFSTQFLENEYLACKNMEQFINSLRQIARAKTSTHLFEFFQIGDGGVLHVLGETHLHSGLEFVISTGLSLIKAGISQGYALKIAVAPGTLGDYEYPDSERRDSVYTENDCRFTELPIFGRGYISAFKLLSAVHGPVFAIQNLPEGLIGEDKLCQLNEHYVLLDWLRHSTSESNAMLKAAASGFKPGDEIERLENYLKRHKADLNDRWYGSAMRLISGYTTQPGSSISTMV